MINRLLLYLPKWLSNILRVAKKRYINTYLLLLINTYYIFHFTEKSKYSNEIRMLNKIKTIIPIPYEYVNEYLYENIDVFYDKNTKLPFVLRGGNKLYFPKELSQDVIRNKYRDLLIEQDPRSPHYYKYSCNCSNKVLLDIGCAEGIWALDLIDDSSHVFLFEPDQLWIDALKATFSPWNDKITIINKFVTDKVTDNETTIDEHYQDFCNEVLIKIDVEGYEKEVLYGAQKTLLNKCIEINCCSYHKINDYEDLSLILRELNFHTQASDGSIIWQYGKDFKPPFFRKAIIRGKKKNLVPNII